MKIRPISNSRRSRRGERGRGERTCVVHEKVKRRARARARVCASARDGLPVSQCVRQERCIALRRCVKASENARLLARSRSHSTLRSSSVFHSVFVAFDRVPRSPLSLSLPPLSPAERRKPPPSSPLLSSCHLPSENTPWDGRRRYFCRVRIGRSQQLLRTAAMIARIPRLVNSCSDDADRSSAEARIRCSRD